MCCECVCVCMCVCVCVCVTTYPVATLTLLVSELMRLVLMNMGQTVVVWTPSFSYTTRISSLRAAVNPKHANFEALKHRAKSHGGKPGTLAVLNV